MSSQNKLILITTWSKRVLFAFLIVSIGGVLSSFFSVIFLGKFNDGYEVTEIHLVHERKEFIGKLLLFTDSLFSITFLIASIFVLIWIYRVAENANRLNPSMGTTPFASIVWFFVPVFHLWMPLLSMLEIWKASLVSSNNTDKRSALIVYTWWILWLLANIPLGFRAMLATDIGASVKILVENSWYSFFFYLSWSAVTVNLIYMVKILFHKESNRV